MPRGVDRADEAIRQGRYWRPRGHGAFSQTELILWLDAMDLSTLGGSSGSITTWRDKSGNGEDGDGVGHAGTFSVNGIKGRPAISFGGSAYYNCTTIGLDSATGAAVYVVTNFNNSTVNNGRLVSVARSAESDFDQTLEAAWIYKTGSNTLGTYRGNGARASTAVTASVPMIIGSIFDASNNFFSLNGTPGSTSAYSQIWGAPYCRIGAHTGVASESYQGLVGEVLILNKTLSTREQRRIEGYLAWKWDLAGNLPASHPFKNRPPMVGD